MKKYYYIGRVPKNLYEYMKKYGPDKRSSGAICKRIELKDPDCPDRLHNDMAILRLHYKNLFTDEEIDRKTVNEILEKGDAERNLEDDEWWDKSHGHL